MIKDKETICILSHNIGVKGNKIQSLKPKIEVKILTCKGYSPYISSNSLTLISARTSPVSIFALIITNALITMQHINI